MIKYDEPLFRPPSEAYSLILQLTLGCSWNECAFCEMYTSKRFKTRSFEDVKNEIDSLKPYSQQIKKVFLADGNALVLSTRRLLEVLNYLSISFPGLNRVSSYAIAKDLNSKSVGEIKELVNAGLKLVYVGIESGDNEVLKRVNKGETFESTRTGLLRAKEAGLKVSVMILNGLGGKMLSNQHAVNSAKIANETQPEYLSTLVMSFPYGESRFISRFDGVFEKLDPPGLINEMKIFIEALELENTVFRSDHASNYLVLKGNLNRDKQKLTDRINYALNYPHLLREEWMRGL